MSNDLMLLDMRFEQDRQNYGTITDVGSCFEIFTVDLTLKNRKLTYDQILDGIVGGGKDGGLDACYIFVNGVLIQSETDLQSLSEAIKIEIFFYQSKHASSIDSTVMLKLTKHLAHFLDLQAQQSTLDLHFNLEVQEKIMLFRAAIEKYFDKEYEIQFRIRYCSRAISDPVDTALDHAKDVEKICTKAFTNSSAEFEFFGASRLYKLSTLPTVSRKTLISTPGNCINSGEDNYVALVRLTDFVDFISADNQLDHNIFEFNVRDYEGDQKPVNKEIASTIQSDNLDTDFWWYNNGITVIADKVKLQGSRLVISNPMIVNGLQTATVIHSNRKIIQNKVGDPRSILVRVISIDKPTVREAVIKATNSQTRLNPLALRATEEYQRKIEDFLKGKGLYYERRKNYYKNRQKPANKITDVSRLGQSVIALNLHKPHEARARPGTFLGKPENYDKVFPDKADLARYYVAASLERSLDTFLFQNRKKYEPILRNNLRFHTLMVLSWALGGRKTKKTDKLDPSTVSNAQLEKVFEWVCECFVTAGKIDAVAKSDSFTQNIIKSWSVSKTKVN